MARHWIASAIKHPGALRRTAHVAAGKDLTPRQLKVLAKRSGVTGQRARLAQTLRKVRR